MIIEINGHNIDTEHYVKKWTDWALAAKPATDEQVIQNVQTLYQKAGLEKPKVKVYREWDEFVKDSVWASMWDSAGAWYWADDLAFADVFSDAKVLSPEKIKELEEYKSLLETQRIALLTKEIAYVLVAPLLRRNQRGFLHSDIFPAVQWGKSGFYYLNGVNFPKDLWEKVTSRNMPFEEILAIENIDQRTQAMRYGEIERFLQHTKATKLDGPTITR